MKNQRMTTKAKNEAENSFDQSQVRRRLKSALKAPIECLTFISLPVFAVIGFALVGGCTDDTIVEPVLADAPPPAPQGVYTVRGDNRVTVKWLPVEASDLDHYDIYRGDDSADGALFTLIGSSLIEEYIDDPVMNGRRFYYTVTAIDLAGFESLQSTDFGGATPRADGFNIQAFTNDVSPNLSGFDLSAGNLVAFDDPRADFWIDRDIDGVLFINADTMGFPSVDFGDIQDMGYTIDLDEIRSASLPPDSSGWSALRFYEVLDGHTYVIWTQDDRYAKVRISSQTLTSVTFDYAYQSGIASDGSGGEPELAPLVGGRNNPQNTTVASKFDRSSGAHRTDTSQRPKNLGPSEAPK